MNCIFSWFCQSKIKFISSRHRVISSLYFLKFPNRNGAKHLIYQYYRNFRFSYVNVKYHRSQKRWKMQCPYHFLPVHILKCSLHVYEYKLHGIFYSPESFQIFTLKIVLSPAQKMVSILFDHCSTSNQLASSSSTLVCLHPED